MLKALICFCFWTIFMFSNHGHHYLLKKIVSWPIKEGIKDLFSKRVFCYVQKARFLSIRHLIMKTFVKRLANVKLNIKEEEYFFSNEFFYYSTFQLFCCDISCYISVVFKDSKLKLGTLIYSKSVCWISKIIEIEGFWRALSSLPL